MKKDNLDQKAAGVIQRKQLIQAVDYLENRKYDQMEVEMSPN